MVSNEHAGTAFVSSAVTGLIVAIPESVLTYAGKIVSVLLLAAVAEIGRRLVNRFWKEKKS